MKWRPIMFSTPMVLALLDGKKTQTRRFANSNRVEFTGLMYDTAMFVDKIPEEQHPTPLTIRCRYGGKGDSLWCKETWRPGPEASRKWEPPPGSPAVEYLADYVRAGKDPSTPPPGSPPWIKRVTGWGSPMFMSKVFARIHLRLTDLRVERLQDITERDAEAEGVEPAPGHSVYPGTGAARTRSYVEGYRIAWDKINGKTHPWSTNPWVFALTLEPTQPIDLMKKLKETP